MAYMSDLLYCISFLEEAMIMYISRGLLRSLTEAKEVMETIAEQNGRLRNKVLINTYAVIDGESVHRNRTNRINVVDSVGLQLLLKGTHNNSA